MPTHKLAIDYDRLSRELLLALRGKRSQRALGTRMQVTSTTVYAWESGRRQPNASLFFRMANSVGLDVGKPLQAALLGTRRAALSSKRLATAEGVAELLRELAQDEPIGRLARAVGVDRTTVARWLRGRSEPRLADLLRFIDATALRLLDVVELFADPAQLPSVQRRYRNLLAQRQLAFDYPFSHAALRALELRAYRDKSDDDATFVAECTGLSREDAQAVLGALAKAGQIRRRGGRYAVSEIMTVDTRVDLKRDLTLKRHWAQVALDRVDAKRLRGDALASYNAFAASNRAYAQIHKLHLDYYDRVRRIIASDTSPERVVLLYLHLLPLDA